MVPFTLRQELGMDSRRRVLFAHWATVMERMSSQIKWIWGNDAYLRYLPINGVSFLEQYGQICIYAWLQSDMIWHSTSTSTSKTNTFPLHLR